jgi:hypothetical protein
MQKLANRFKGREVDVAPVSAALAGRQLARRSILRSPDLQQSQYGRTPQRRAPVGLPLEAADRRDEAVYRDHRKDTGHDGFEFPRHTYHPLTFESSSLYGGWRRGANTVREEL